MSTNSDDQKYIDACKIVDAYEKASRLTYDKSAALINMDSNLVVLEEILRAAEKSLEGMTSSGIPGGSHQNVKPLSGDGSTGPMPSPGSANSCEDETTGNENQESGFNPVLTLGEGEYKTEPYDPYDHAISKIAGNDQVKAKDIKESMNRCFDCDLRASFDFSIRPINFLSELIPLIDSLMDIIDQAIEDLQPADLAIDLCNLFDNFKWWCPADLISIIVALQGLTTRYFGQAIKLAVNWTFIVGPLISFIVDMVAKFFEQLRRMIVAPLDCAAGLIGVFLNLTDTAIGGYDAAAAFADTFKEFTPGSAAYRSKQQTKKELGSFDPQWQSPKYGMPGKNTAQLLDSKNKMNIPTSWSFSMNDTLETSFNKKKQARNQERRLKERENNIRLVQKKQNEYLEGKDFSKSTDEELREIQEKLDSIKQNTSSNPLKSALLAINSSKEWVNEMFANILLAVKSLNSWVVGSIGLSMKIGGYILMLLDLIKLIQVIIHLVNNGWDIKRICEEQANDPEGFKDKLDRMLWNWDTQATRDDIQAYREQLSTFNEEAESIGCNSNLGS